MHKWLTYHDAPPSDECITCGVVVELDPDSVGTVAILIDDPRNSVPCKATAKRSHDFEYRGRDDEGNPMLKCHFCDLVVDGSTLDVDYAPECLDSAEGW